MVVVYCKIMLNMLSYKVLILFNIYIFCHLSYYSCFSCGKKCFLSGDYDKIVSNIKKLMQDPCSRSGFFLMFLLLFCICFFSFCLFVFLFFLFSFSPRRLIRSPRVRYANLRHINSEAIPEKKRKA